MKIMNKSLNIFELISLSLEALRRNRMRTILSVIGIVIGISTLIVVLGISGAAEGLIKNQLASFGSDTIFVEVKVPNTTPTGTSTGLVNGTQIKTMKISDVTGVLKIANVKDSYAAVFGQKKVGFENQSKQSFIFGTTPSYINIDKSKIDRGRFFNEAENNSLAKVAVIGQNIKTDLFGSKDPIGKTIRINQISFRVIGIMEKRGAVFFQNYDDYVYLPIKTEQKILLGYDFLPYFVTQVIDSKKMSETKDDITRFLRRQHHIVGDDPKKDDFEITTSEDSFNTISVVFGAVSILFAGIASISLIVGGVGIMNIMYVSVTERIREIGLRKAIGARRRDILTQFLLEAVAITLLGGLLGIFFGFLLSILINFGAQSAGVALQLSISPLGLFLGIIVTIAFGIIFGFGPAQKASRLQPIEALRAD